MANRHRWWRVGQVALAVLVIGIAVRRLVVNWSELRSESIDWRVRPVWLIASVLIVWAAYAALVDAWRRVVVSMRQRLSYLSAAKICMVSNLGKYIPGKVWAIAGNALLSQRAGVEPHAAIAGAILNQALSLGSGIALIGVLGPTALRESHGEGQGAYLILTIVFAGLALGAILTMTSSSALRFLRRILPPSVPTLTPVPSGIMLGSLGVNALAWAAYGLAFLLLAHGLTPEAALTWNQATTVFTVSYLVGLIAVFAPGGVGVRESAFTLLLAPHVGLKLAITLALATRVQLTITELGAALPFLLIRKRTRP